MYMQNVKWFTAVVEDVHDPLLAGRVKVRCHGYHTQDKTEIPTKDLPWAGVMLGNHSSSLEGASDTHRLLVGTWVFGVFMDGDAMQVPLVIGSFPGSGPDYSPLTRGEDNTTRHKDSLIAWPSSSYKTEYPNNRVIETSSGHVIELDDTEGAERVRLYHRTGTQIEMNPDGTMTTFSTKDNYKAVLGNEEVHIVGNVKIFVDGNVEATVAGEVKVDAAKNVSANVGGNLDASISGNATVSASNVTVNASLTTINGNLVVAGNTTVDGTVTAAVDCVGGGISLKGHTHPHGDPMSGGPV